MPPDGMEAYRLACEATSRAWRPREKLSVWQWADRNVYLPPESSAEPGKYKTDRVPMSREVMECLSPHHPCRKVVVMASSQVFKTAVGINWLLYHIHHDPKSMLVVYPTIETAEEWSKQRLTPTVEASPAVAEVLPASRSRESGNTTRFKVYPGGVAKIAGANSAPSLAGMPCPILYCDEVDRYPPDVDGEGDPVTVARRAQITFPRRKEYLSSSPTIESLSRINREFKHSDRRYYHVPCPECGEKQVLKWDNFKWDDGRPDTAHFVCVHNACIIREHHKPRMFADKAMGGEAEWIPEAPESKVPGFHAWAAYSSLGLGHSWAELAEKWDEVKGDPEKEKAYINIYRGECFRDPTEKLDWEQIKQRAGRYDLRSIPAGCLVLTAGVDVQGNRLAVQVLGWGRDGRVWVVDWIELPGDPTKPEVWEALDELLLRPIVNRFGISMKISAVAVDSGYLPDEVLKFVRPREQRSVFAVKGSSTPGHQAIGTAQRQDRNARGKQLKRGVKAWLVGSDTIKQTIFLWLQADGPLGDMHRRVHFSDELPDEYYTQLCAEIYDPHKRKWVKQQTRNEALDTFVYAVSAARHPRLRVHVYRESDWARLESVLEPQSRDLFSPGVAPAAPPAAAVQTSAQPEKPAEPADTEWVRRDETWLER